MRREGEFLKSVGVDVGSIAFGGGAGGERADLVTPRATVTLLRAMARRPDFSAFEAALPILGRDGTLASAVSSESPARGHVRAKTGTYFLDNPLNGRSVLTSKALAGFIDSASGRTLVFAFFVNNAPIEAQDERVNAHLVGAGRLLGKLAEVFYDCAPSAPAQPAVEKAGDR
jgi:D-alanyl-D-alanine carboxypeptidase/D-alanyl-D-alanine-endopeptidase (penicillin-binding protein 4)